MESLRPIKIKEFFPEERKLVQTVNPIKKSNMKFNSQNHGRIVSGTEAPETRDLIFAGEVYVEDPNMIKLPK